MEFDITSMKQRAKGLLGSTKPSPLLMGFTVIIFYVAFEIIAFVRIEKPMYPVIMLCLELICLCIRNCRILYGMKLTREEITGASDMFLAFKEKQILFFLLGIIKDICYIVGAMFCFVGILFPFYWFRFSTYIMEDESVNPFKALWESAKLIKGHCPELIKLDITNIGWIILEFCTGGIAGIYVEPYLSVVYAEFYDYLKGQKSLYA